MSVSAPWCKTSTQGWVGDRIKHFVSCLSVKKIITLREEPLFYTAFFCSLSWTSAESTDRVQWSHQSWFEISSLGIPEFNGVVPWCAANFFSIWPQHRGDGFCVAREGWQGSLEFNGDRFEWVIIKKIYYFNKWKCLIILRHTSRSFKVTFSKEKLFIVATLLKKNPGQTWSSSYPC